VRKDGGVQGPEEEPGEATQPPDLDAWEEVS
jgi:hypothetical protein